MARILPTQDAQDRRRRLLRLRTLLRTVHVRACVRRIRRRHDVGYAVNRTERRMRCSASWLARVSLDLPSNVAARRRVGLAIMNAQILAAGEGEGEF
jgi:hypothetical protein